LSAGTSGLERGDETQTEEEAPKGGHAGKVASPKHAPKPAFWGGI